MIKPSFLEKTKFENLTEKIPINFLLFLFLGTIRNESTVAIQWPGPPLMNIGKIGGFVIHLYYMFLIFRGAPV